MAKGQDGPFLWHEEGDVRIVPVADVAVKAPIDKTYSYAVPDDMLSALCAGQRVLVPFGRSGRSQEGFVLDVSQREWTTSLRPLQAVIDDAAWLDDTLLALGRWISAHYDTPLGLTLAAMVPAAARGGSGFRTQRHVSLTAPADTLRAGAPRLGPRQSQLLEHMPPPGEWIDCARLAEHGVSTATVRDGLRRSWLTERSERRRQAAPLFDEPLLEPGFTLNDAQRQACTQIAAALTEGRHETYLLYGISGSGKTEVYIDAMKRCVAAGRQAILLVPEIALTTQLVHRFASRLQDVAVLHSGLTERQRSLTWHAIRAGERRVIIGTRSAIFAPCADVGLVVVDEEQDTSFKNQQSPKFCARDVAVERGRLHNIPVILGSATPALETWHACRTDPTRHVLHLPHRAAGARLPEVELVDMREEVAVRGAHRVLSRLLEQRIGETLARREQGVLFLNQRGYACALFCPRCRATVRCDHCKASLVLHRATGTMCCHHCQRRSHPPDMCANPSCGTRLLQFGVGTERAEEELHQFFPNARIQRVDSDTMTHPAEYERVIRAFERRTIDLLIGTQIVAKGLDFPMVSLVGVISADTALHQPDFRAGERTFQLVTQVAGRAGRAQTPGRVVVQTVMPDLQALQSSLTHDYDGFAESELALRREMRFPPYTCLVRWVLSDATESKLIAEAEKFAVTLQGACRALAIAGAEVMGPTPCVLQRIRGRYRRDVVVSMPTIAERTQFLKHLRTTVKPRARVHRVMVDVDPVSLL